MNMPNSLSSFCEKNHTHSFGANKMEEINQELVEANLRRIYGNLSSSEEENIHFLKLLNEKS